MEIDSQKSPIIVMFFLNQLELALGLYFAAAGLC